MSAANTEADTEEQARRGRLVGKVVIVTGGGSGLGRYYCEALAGENARVVVADLGGEAAVETAAAINAKYPEQRAVAIPTDVTDQTSVEAMVSGAVEAFGTVDVLFNNVGTYPHKDFEEITYDDWRNVVTVNLDSVFLCSKAVLPVMKAKGAGKIINVATNLVWIGLPSMVHYISAKAGIIGFTRSLAREIGGYGITVNAFAPGAVMPPVQYLDLESLERAASIIDHQAIKRSMEATDLIGMVVFLASTDSDFVSGQIFTVDGGLTNH